MLNHLIIGHFIMQRMFFQVGTNSTVSANPFFMMLAGQRTFKGRIAARMFGIID
jgi:hypothetical protein